jgi:hypothetical protein
MQSLCAHFHAGAPQACEHLPARYMAIAFIVDAASDKPHKQRSLVATSDGQACKLRIYRD